MAFTFVYEGEPHEISVSDRTPELVITVDGRAYAVSEAGALDGEVAWLTVDGRTYQVWRTHEGERVHLRLGARTFTVGYEDPIRAARHQAGGDDTLRADMPGVVVEVSCAPEAAVAAGDVLMTLESMKMQIAVTAPRDGVVDAVYVAVNDSFDKGAELVSLHTQD